MSKISQIKSYITAPSKCFIPKCKARCCINAPLPEGFLEKFQSRIQRTVYSGINIGQNDPKDSFNSIVYSTRPIQFIGYDENGKSLYGISKDMLEKLQLKSMEDVQRLLKEYDEKEIYNYCPFITDYARCSVYEHRPSICRDFGSSPLKVDRCPDKSSRLDIFKFFFKNFFKNLF